MPALRRDNGTGRQTQRAGRIYPVKDGDRIHYWFRIPYFLFWQLVALVDRKRLDLCWEKGPRALEIEEQNIERLLLRVRDLRAKCRHADNNATPMAPISFMITFLNAPDPKDGHVGYVHHDQNGSRLIDEEMGGSSVGVASAPEIPGVGPAIGIAAPAPAPVRAVEYGAPIGLSIPNVSAAPAPAPVRVAPPQAPDSPVVGNLLNEAAQINRDAMKMLEEMRAQLAKLGMGG